MNFENYRTSEQNTGSCEKEQVKGKKKEERAIYKKQHEKNI